MAESEPPGVAVAHGSDPVRWWVFDGWHESHGEVAFWNAVPGPAWEGWEAKYDNDAERGKRTTRRIDWLPLWGPLFGRMRRLAGEWSERLGYAVEDDPYMHGGGLHVTGPGGYLSCHLDYDLSPVVLGKRRALNLIAFLNPEWREEWGGALCLCDPVGNVVRRFYPAPGRLLAFETNDLSYHAVEEVTGPAERVTAAVYFLAEPGPWNVRRRAMFLPKRG